MSKLLLVFDWETTGLALHPDADVRKQPKAIEFGGAFIDCADGSLVERHERLINPGEPLEAIITKITGLTDAMLKDAPSFGDVLPEFRKMFARASGMLSHNLPFDRAILRGELARRNMNIADFPWPMHSMCTVGMYKEHWGRNPKLTELYEQVMGKPLAQTHRAMGDVNALVEIVQKEELWRFVHP